MMEAARTSETSVDNHFTRQYNPEDSSEQLFHSSNAYVARFYSTLLASAASWTGKQASASLVKKLNILRPAA
jgi:hypothetical protein